MSYPPTLQENWNYEATFKVYEQRKIDVLCQWHFLFQTKLLFVSLWECVWVGTLQGGEHQLHKLHQGRQQQVADPPEQAQ